MSKQCRCGHPWSMHHQPFGGSENTCHMCPGCRSLPDESVDMVNHPPHYTSHPSGVECIQVTEHQNFCIGNAIKYLWRCDGKNGLEDLKKARWYVDREIARREKAGA